MTSTRFQRHACTLKPIHIAAQSNGHFIAPDQPHSPPKPSFDGFLSYYHSHIDPTQYQPPQLHQSATMMYVRLQSLHQLVFHVVDLAKRVPGFRFMTQHDQLHVIKRQFSTLLLSSLLLLLSLWCVKWVRQSVRGVDGRQTVT